MFSSFLEAFKLIVSFLVAAKKFLTTQKKKQIIYVKDKALEKGDQRELENILSETDSSDGFDLPVGKYNGMYERAVKKKP